MNYEYVLTTMLTYCRFGVSVRSINLENKTATICGWIPGRYTSVEVPVQFEEGAVVFPRDLSSRLLGGWTEPMWFDSIRDFYGDWRDPDVPRDTPHQKT